MCVYVCVYTFVLGMYVCTHGPCVIVFSLPQRYVEDKFRFTTFCFQYAMFIVQFFLSAIPEPKPPRTYFDDEVGKREGREEVIVSYSSYLFSAGTMPRARCNISLHDHLVVAEWVSTQPSIFRSFINFSPNSDLYTIQW